MPFKKGLSKHLKNIVYKHSLASRPAENSRHILYNYTPAPARRDDNFKPITTFKIIKNI